MTRNRVITMSRDVQPTSILIGHPTKYPLLITMISGNQFYLPTPLLPQNNTRIERLVKVPCEKTHRTNGNTKSLCRSNYAQDSSIYHTNQFVTWGAYTSLQNCNRKVTVSKREKKSLTHAYYLVVNKNKSASTIYSARTCFYPFITHKH